MPIKKLKDFLDKNHIKYVSIHHSKAYTMQEIAAKTHIPGKNMAKTIMINIEGKIAMAVLPASYQIDFDMLKDIFGTKKVNLATEAEFKYYFPDCELGAMPPFGNLFDMEVYVAQSLSEDKEISFNAGSHTELLKLNYADFHRLVEPRVFKFSRKNFSFPPDRSERWANN